MEYEPKTIPYSKEAEESLLGAVMLNPESLFELRDKVAAKEFYFHKNQWIWESVVSVYNRDEPVDIVTVGEELRKRGKLEEVGGTFYITGLMNDVPSSLHANAYASRVREKATRRKLFEEAGMLANDALDESKEINEIVSTHSKAINEQSTVEDTGIQLVDMVSGTIDVIAERIEQRARGERIDIGFQTGIGYIDRNFHGLKKGWLVYLAGSANVGKTQLAIQVSKVLAKQAPGSYVALEGDKESTVYRMLEGMMRVDAVDIEFGKVDATALYATLGEFEGLDYEFFYQPRLSVSELRAYVAKQKAERNIGWMFVDYVSLLEVAGKDRNEKDENMSQELRRICGEFNILLIGLDSIVKSGASGILSIEDIAGRYSKQHDSDITFGYSDYRPIKGIAQDLDDFERERRCRLMGVLKDRHRKNKGKIFPLEMDSGYVNDLLETSNKPYV